MDSGHGIGGIAPQAHETAPGAARHWDPLAGLREQDGPPLDVLMCGTVFYDLIFTGMDRLPGPGEEIWTQGMGSCPGGIANLAVASSRLGLHTGLVAGFGDDAYAAWLWHTLADQEHIDLSASKRFNDFHTAITVSMSIDGDRSMVTHGHELPVRLGQSMIAAPAARAAVVDLAGESSWCAPLAARGTRIFADIGFDETGRWDPSDLAPLAFCHAFTPNAVEAMHYTRTDSASAAVRALADKVPLAVVTDGVNGAYAIDQSTGEEAFCPAVPVKATDPTGAGDVFAAASVLGVLAGWPLANRLKFASLCSALAVQQFGGSLAAPGWGDITDWWHTIMSASDAGDLRMAYIRDQYGFLSDVIPTCTVKGVRRAQATFALASDADVD